MGKSKIKPFLIAGGIILVILLIIGIILYIKTDFLKSNKKLFIKYFSRNVEQIDDVGFEAFTRYKKYTKDTNYSNSETITFNFEDGLGSVQESNNTYSIKVNSSRDVTNFKTGGDISLDYNDQSLLLGKIYNNNDLYGISIDGITNDIVAIRNSNLKELVDNMGYSEEISVPNIITFPEDINFTSVQNDFGPVFSRLMEDFEDYFPKNSFTKNKNKNIYIETSTFPSNEYILVVRTKEFYDFVKKELNKAKSDEGLKSIFYNYLNITGEEYNKMIEEELVKIDNILANNDGETPFKISVYESDKKFIKLVAGTDTLNYEYYIYDVEGIYKIYYSYKNINVQDRTTIESTDFNYTNEYDENNVDLTFNFIVKNRETTEEALKKNKSIKLKYSLLNVEEKGLSKSISLTYNNKKIIDWKNRITIGVNTDIQDINSNNAKILNDLSKDEIFNLINEIKYNMNNFDLSTFRDNVEPVREEPKEIIFINTNDLYSATADLKNAFTKLIANYTLDNEGARNLLDFLNQDRMNNYLGVTDAYVELNDAKNVLIYTNPIGGKFEFYLEVTNQKIDITESHEYIEPEPEPDSEPREPVPVPVPYSFPEAPEDGGEEPEENVILNKMKEELNKYFESIYNLAFETGEPIYVSEYINPEKIVQNCSTVKEAGVLLQEDNTYYLECKDENGEIYSGLVKVTEEGIKLLMFN